MGGVDLNSALMEMVVEGGQDIQVNAIDLGDVASYQGLSPSIINVQPFKNLLTIQQ